MPSLPAFLRRRWTLEDVISSKEAISRTLFPLACRSRICWISSRSSEKERARELEAELYYPEITDDEQEYLDLFHEYAADGEISVRDRSLLNKLRDRMGISEERAAELESMK